MNKTTKTGLAVAVGMALVGSAVAQAETVDHLEGKAPKKTKKHHQRMALELAGIFAVGNRWYWRDNGSPNIVDWQLPWGADAIDAKLTSTGGWRFDGNPYDINALGHPGFGLMTQFLGRENGYTIGESFLISTLASGTWEVFLEWAEYGSLNDLLTTSTAGVPLGETAYQILHHAHETVFTAAAGVGTSGGAPFGVVEIAGDLSTVPTHGEGKVGGGRAVRFDAEVQADEAVRTVRGGARANLAGYYRHTTERSLFGALTTHFDYANDRERDERDWDLMTTVGIGPSIDVAVRRGGATVTVGADAFVDVGLVKAQAYDTWRMAHPTEVVRNVMQDKEQPYYYAMGATVAPHVDLSFKQFRTGAKLAATAFTSMEGHDRDQEMLTADPSFTDSAARASAWVGYDRKGVSVTVEGRLNRRGGSAGTSEASTSDRTAMFTVGFSR